MDTLRPLVANTRDEAADGPFAQALDRAGLQSWACPTIAIVPPDDPRELAAALDRLSEFAWIAFTSAHAVDATCARPEWSRAAAQGMLPRIAAVGSATANRLEAFGIPAATVPEIPNSEALAASILETAGSLAGVSVLWPRADIAPTSFARALSTWGATVTAPVAYRTIPVSPESLAPLRDALAARRVAAIAFCSPSSARGLARGLGVRDLSSLSGRLIVASIGPTTSDALRALSLTPDVEAITPSTSMLAAAIAERLAVGAGDPR
jgi:uroporphyrinogen-III synthase